MIYKYLGKLCSSKILKAEQFNIFITMEMSVLDIEPERDILNPVLKLLR